MPRLGPCPPQWTPASSQPEARSGPARAHETDDGTARHETEADRLDRTFDELLEEQPGLLKQADLILSPFFAGSCLRPATRAGRHRSFTWSTCGGPAAERSGHRPYALSLPSIAAFYCCSVTAARAGWSRSAIGWHWAACAPCSSALTRARAGIVLDAPLARWQLLALAAWVLLMLLGLRGNALPAWMRGHPPRHCLMCESDRGPGNPGSDVAGPDNLGQNPTGAALNMTVAAAAERGRAREQVSVPARARLRQLIALP